MPGFMIQGGDPARGKEGVPSGAARMNSTRTTPMMREVLSMANKGPDTNRSQFFLTFAPQPHLNDKCPGSGTWSTVLKR